MSGATAIESVLAAAMVSHLETALAGLSPEPTVRTWRDQTTAATYPAVLVHCPPATPAPENVAIGAVLWRATINVAATTHAEATPPATPADPAGSHCQDIYDACRAAVLDGIPSFDGLTVLDARIDDGADTGDGFIHMLTFRVSLAIQIGD